MIVPDLNVLLYATNSGADRHLAARRWMDGVLSDVVPVGLAWVVILGFVRLSTSPRVFPAPLHVDQALGLVEDWLAQPPVRALEPTSRHWPILTELLHGLGAAGNLTADAHLAALAIEHGATLVSTDNDFARFPGLRWSNPLS